MRALANAGAKRPPALPYLPTVAEQGLPGFDAASWVALVAPARTPAPVLAKLRSEVDKVIKSTDVAARLNQMGSEPGTASEPQVGAFLDAETRKWAEVIRLSRRRRIEIRGAGTARFPWAAKWEAEEIGFCRLVSRSASKLDAVLHQVDDAGDGVGAAAGLERHDQANRALGRPAPVTLRTGDAHDIVAARKARTRRVTRISPETLASSRVR